MGYTKVGDTTNTVFEDTGLNADTWYSYVVSAYNDKGEGAWSNTDAVTYALPNPKIEEEGFSHIKLNWPRITNSAPSGDADAYKIYRAQWEGGVYEQIGMITDPGIGNIPNYNDTYLSSDTRYYYGITALRSYIDEFGYTQYREGPMVKIDGKTLGGGASKYEVTYNKNHGYPEIEWTDPTEYETNDNVILKGITNLDFDWNRTAEGWAFKGWIKDSQTGTAISGTSFVMENADVILYAKWEEIDYTVTYYENDGTNNRDFEETTPYNVGDTVTLKAITNGDFDWNRTAEGWEFKGWAKGSPTGTVVTGPTFTMETANVDLYAKWEKIEYIVTYYENDGTHNNDFEETTKYNVGDSVTLREITNNDFDWNRTTEGWEFKGWAKGSPTGTVVTGTSFAMETANVDLYAKWKKINYTVTYYENDGTRNSEFTGSTLYQVGDTVPLKEITNGDFDWNRTAEGFKFEGWSKDSAVGTPLSGTSFTMTAGNVKLYAQWTPIYTVTFDANGGVFDGSETVSGTGIVQSFDLGKTVLTVEEIESGAVISSPSADPTWIDHGFVSWHEKENGNLKAEAWNPAAPITKDLELFAKWTEPAEKTYRVIYHANGADDESKIPIDATEYPAGAYVTVKANENGLTKGNDIFKGWNTKPAGDGTHYDENQANAFQMGTENVVLYAEWAPTYTVTYMPNGATSGTAPTDSSRYESGDSVTTKDKNMLDKTGHAFLEWNTLPDGTGTTYGENQVDAFQISNGNVILYAIWDAGGIPQTTFTVTYDENGATSGTVPVDGNSYNLADFVTTLGNTGTLTKTDFVFKGWNTLADGTGVHYDENQANAFQIYNDVILYAEWAPTYTVTYDANYADSGTVPIDGTRYEYNDAVYLQENTGNLEKANSKFIGWNTLPDGTGTSYDADISEFFLITENTRLYAEWTPVYTVTYHGNTETAGTPPTDSAEYENGESVMILDKNTLVKSGYTFKNWNTLADGSGTVYNQGATLTMPDHDVDLYAQWKKNSSGGGGNNTTPEIKEPVKSSPAESGTMQGPEPEEEPEPEPYMESAPAGYGAWAYPLLLLFLIVIAVYLYMRYRKRKAASQAKV
ncbi:hypothetical protein MmiEs2_15870 [Methanimicrococcus stummii]|uniref:Fibronectin type-III domain-containing protein n=1 Tax=Methanimicrococcus stummii TaxID=3028294 RepID=A0AA96ZXS8_9EURY|nr:InlB B-repeat-containing protein [Methanimicrococcus sp. Es2]WNY29360.1 hypothetical protein MmiEs2_15870 [Methanimicrococcus sp. Es2]